METRDPFNYPSLNRKDLMSLSTINQFKDGTKTTAKNFVSNRNNSTNLYTHDIEGAQPKLFGSKVLNKPDTQNYNMDIDGSAPRLLHVALEKPETNLRTNDIEGTKPNAIIDTIKTNRATNPLMPEYSLPVVAPCPPTPPKFLKDSINHDDIIGSRPKKQVVYSTRETMDIKDIDGTHAKKFKPRNTRYDNIDYSDLTKEEFHTKRVVDPQNPVYNLKDAAGNPINYGYIEGSNPKKLPMRVTGALSTDLKTHDIIGAQAGTKGLGPFAERARVTNKVSVTTEDIEGARAGTIKNGALSKRLTDPMNPDYPILGATEKVRQDMAYAGPGKEQPIRKANTRLKPEWKKSTVIPIIEDKKVPTSAPKIQDPLKAAASEALKNNMAKFYGINARDIKEQDLSRFAEEAKRGIRDAPTPVIDKKLQADPEFIDHAHKFFGEKMEDSKVEWSKNVNKFYRENELGPEEKVAFTLAEKKEDKNSNSEGIASMQEGRLYQRNEARFFGEKSDERASSKGSVYQQNAAHFFGYDTPSHGERPFIPPTDAPKPLSTTKPILAQRKMVNEQRDPKYQNNMAKFFGAEPTKASKAQLTYEQRLHKFIG